MARFSDLPLDLLPYVLEYLGKRQYHCLARVCKSLHREVLPYLYHTITFCATSSQGNAQKLAWLFRVLMERPGLAAHVRRLKLSGSLQSWKREHGWTDNADTWAANLWGLEGCNVLTGAQITVASNRFYQLVDDESCHSLAQYRGRSKDALATLTLTLLRGLTKLEVDDGFLTYSLFLPHVLQRASWLFPKLKHIILGCSEHLIDTLITHVDIGLIRSVFYHPNVDKFEWTMSQSLRLSPDRLKLPKTVCMTTLHLFRSNISSSTLSKLLSSTPNLKSLQYQQQVSFTRDRRGSIQTSSHSHFFEFNTALAKVMHTLEELRLSLDCAPGSFSYEEIMRQGLVFPPIHGTITILKTMENLRLVEIPMVMLLGWDDTLIPRLEAVLPRGIEEITMRSDFVRLSPWASGVDCTRKVSYILNYLQRRDLYAPHLRCVQIKIISTWGLRWLRFAVINIRASLASPAVLHSITYVTSDTQLDTEKHNWCFDDAIAKKDS